MASRFVGRTEEFDRLGRLRQHVLESGEGVLVALRGRRQVGKSTLIQQFIESTGDPSVFYTAARRQDPRDALADFAGDVAASSLPNAHLGVAGTFASWDQALDAITTTSAAADHVPVIVLDELPWLIESTPALEGLIQRVWDRQLQHRKVMVILIGSDLSMMEALTSYGRPLFDRVRLLKIDPLNPADVSDLADLDAKTSIEAWAITGGFPNLVREWRPQESVASYLRRQLADIGSSFIVSGERKLAAEFPADANPRQVLEAIGSGAREYGKVATRAGINAASLDRSLALLIDKAAVAKDVAYSATTSKNSRYVVADPHLRFWLRFVGPSLPAIERGAGASVLDRTIVGWAAWAGEAVEPIIRESVIRLLLREEASPSVGHVGHWWKRDHSMEVDIVAGDRFPVARSIAAVGSIKWRDQHKFDRDDFVELSAARSAVPGATDSQLVAVSRTGFESDFHLDHAWTADDLISSWR